MNLNDFMDTYTTEIIGGLLASIIILAFTYIKKFLMDFTIRKKYSGYIGNYNLYSFSSSGEDTITTTKISIKTKLGSLIVYANNKDIYHYVGKMSISERNLYINLNGIHHVEKVQLIFYSPLHRRIRNLLGSVNAVSILGEPFSSVCILSDKDMSEDEVKEEFKNNGFAYKKSMLKVSPSNSIFFDNIPSS